ncbi:hypothetical protein IAU60_006615 [Kwoniella sp. DSM 27419]
MKVRKPVKRRLDPPPDVAALITYIADAPDAELLSRLKSFTSWLYPRGDLTAWINVLDRLDDILAGIITEYQLDQLQTNDFSAQTKELLLEVLRVLRLLLDNTTNRRAFASYDAYANQTPFEPIHRHAILHRLLTLSRGWERITNDGISLVDLLSPDVSLPADIREVSIQYYPLSEGVRDSPDVHKRQKPRIIGPSTLDLGNVVGSSDPITQLKSLATEHRISLEDQYVGLQRLRLARMEDHTIRHQLLTIRLLALATYVFISNESAAQSALFLYEPELINQLSDLVRSSQIDTVTTGAIHALYACAHHNAKSTEVLSTVCANVGHGSVISRLRLVVEAFQADRQVPYDLVDALIAFIAYIVQSPSHSNMLIGAGILRVLLDVPTTTAADRDQYIPRMTGLLDSFIFSTTQSHSNFSAIDGVNTLVSITKTEIERRVSTVDPTPTSTLSSVNSPLKGVLRSLQRLLSASGGTEGLRNLVDSELPKCLKRIFEQPGVFGTRVYALAIQTMATFVHNEPTSLSILQELDLPQTLYTQLELGIPASPEVISMVNNAIGAVCLNQAGLDHTIAHPKVVTNLVDILLQSSHANILNERDHAKNLGASLDELSRHQPLLRPIIMRAVIAILRRVRADASAFVPPEKEKRDYSLNAMTSSDDAETQPVPTNDYLLAVLRIFRTTSKDFVDAGGITHLLDLSDSPCLPVRFGPTQAGNAFTTLLKHIAEHDHIKLLETIIGAVQATIPLCNPLFEDEAHWAHLHTGNATPELRDSLTALQQLMIRLMFLTEALSFNTNSQARAAASILRLLNETNIMIKLGKIHRVTYRQHTLLQRGKKSTNPPNPAEDFARDSGAQFAATKVNTMLAKIFKIDVMSLGVATLMLFDGRGRGTEPQLHTTLFLVFMSKGGFGCLLDLCKTVIAATDGTADTTSGIRVVLALLNGFASTESLIENPETHALQQRPQKPLPAVDLFVIIRSSIFPLANEIWSAEWLVRCPLLTMKLALRCFSTLMSGKSEDPPSTEELAPQAITSSVHRHSPLVADPGRVEQLVDMGFARSVAERALVRARNDVANAAELLLSMAHLFEDAPVAAQAEPQSQPSAEHSELPTVAESVQQETPPTPPDIVDELEDIIKSASSSREALERLRADNRSTVSSRALIILDHAEELVNDALPLFPEGEEGIAYILEKLFLVASSTVDEEQPAIASRLRLASVHIRSTERPLDDDQTKKAVAILASLPLETNPRPKWFPAMLSFAETVYASSIDIVKAKIGDPPDGVLLRSVDLTHVSSRLATIVYALVSDASTSRDELIASLRLLVLLTRVQPPTLEQALQLLNPFKQSSDRLSGCHPLVLLIMRHAFEDKSTLTENMRREIRHWLSPSSSKVVDINVFVQKLRQVALREATCFVKAVEEECALIDPKPPQSVYHITTKATQPGADPVAKPSDPFVDNPDEKRNPLIDHLVLETGMAVRASLAENGESHTYAGFLMSILCELVGSYTSTKKAFLTSLREQGFGFKTRGVGSLITDMVCSVSFAPDITGVPPFDGSSLPARRLAVSSWASTLILALCADIVPSAAKGATDDLIATRKVVIDAIAKSLRDTNLLADLPSRFGRLWAIGELVHRLLKDQPGASRQAGEYSLQMAKIMLEKNFVSLLTNALGELDLNYPDVRNVLVNLLRALDHLIGGELGDEDEEDMDEEDEDDDMDDEGGTETEDDDESMGSGLEPDNWDAEDEDDGTLMSETQDLEDEEEEEEDMSEAEGSQAIRIDFAQDETGHIGLTVNGRSLPLNGHVQQVPRNVDLLLEYAPRPTKQRWLEEMNLATTSRNETSSRLVIHLVNRLLPDARRRADEEDAKNKIADHGATEVLAGRQVTQLGTAMDVALPASQPASPGVAEDLDVAMNDTADHAAAQAPRTVIFIHGREVDITDTGIDLDFLEALPDEMRADVVEQHLREHARHRRPVNPSVPESVSQLNAEFLDALPPDIRTEVIMQEAIANARRQNPPPAAAAAPAVPVPASSGFLAALSDELREVIMSNSTGNGLEAATQPGPGNTSKKTHREALLLLDKPGIASLVRLLFFPETLKKGPLFRILVNLCENTVSRTDLLNLLLSVVQDGSGDLPAVDKSFQQLSLRGVVTPKATPKSKNVESPAPSLPNGLFSHLQTEHVPTFIAQRCFEALAYIVATNSSAVTYFLTEHEQPVGLRKSTKQGKGKEKSIIQTKFPIVVLLGLLDRPLLAKTPNMMETLTSLLATITKPLADASEHLPRPIVPPSVLRLVVNCLTEGECTSRTFSQSLLAMRHLAYLSGAKEVLLQELRTRSKDLGRLAHEQLVQLSSALEGKATEIDSDTLANFFPPTSIQAQLLRLLKAIDYLYLNKVNSDAPQSQMTEDEKAVGAVFESFDFKSLWDQLGYCLNRVEERGDTDQIATVLLPLVEALMVISKYHGESPREIRSPSVPPAESDLFVSFTTAHRKVLNTIVRNNPSLLSGSFSLLIRNSRVLEFDNKRNWFFQKLKRKRDTPAANSVLKLNVRRQYVFDDSFHALQRYTGDEVKYGKLTVKFYHEDGVDAGGVTREWYSVLAQQIFDPNFEDIPAEQSIFYQEFTIEDEEFGEKKIVELKRDGASIPVTEENKEEYVRLVVSYRLDNSIKDQIKAFLEGFYDVIPLVLISGITTVDVDELKNATQLSGWKATDPEIAWFWRALRSFSQEERSRFLMFVTSSSRVPLGGFTQLQGSSGIQPFQIQKEGSLPQASTCFNLLLLPSYGSYEQLRERLQFAIVETGGFGKA